MNYVGSKDYCQIYLESVISNVDFDVITRLYQPLIGYKAAILYLSLVNHANLNDGDIILHEQLFNIMQITSTDFLYARQALEACGLMKTYLRESDIKKYIYVLYAPKSPKEFFNDILFKGLLVRNIGEKEATKLAMYYHNQININDEKNVSYSFLDFFQPDFDNDCFRTNISCKVRGHDTGKVDTKFSLEDFFNQLKETTMINENAFSKKECIEIERIAALYGLNAIDIADLVANAYDETKRKGERVNFPSLIERAIYVAKNIVTPMLANKKEYTKISSDTPIAIKVKMLEETSPTSFLRERQDGAPPVTADLRLINFLSFDMGLENGVINALLDYCLMIHNNILSKSYVEKLAASLRREKITSALDALNYLNSGFKEKKNYTKIESKNKKMKEKVIEDTKDDDSYDEKEYEDLINRVTKGK